jgi:hypothetical protein
LEEDHDESRREALEGIAVIIPDLRRIEAGRPLEPLDRPGRAEDHVDPAHVRHPALPDGPPAVELVDVLEAFFHLVLVFVLGRRRGRVPLLPEGLDEDVPFPVVRQGHENVPLGGEDEGGRELEPVLMLGIEVLFPGLLLRGDESGQSQDEDESENGEAGEGPAFFGHGLSPVSGISG